MDYGVQIGERFVPRDVILQRAARAATGFRALGVEREDTVALLLRNDVAYLEATLGIRTVGALPVPINWHLSGEEIAYILADAGAKALVIHSDLLHRIEGYIPENVIVLSVETPGELASAYGLQTRAEAGRAGVLSWHDWLSQFEPWNEAPVVETSSMIYTSGTTGRPKGVRRAPATPEQYAKLVSVVAQVLGIEPGMRTVIPAPMYHAAPNSYSVFSMQMETFMVLMPRFDAEDLLRIIERHRITRLQMVPTMFVRLLKLPESVRSKYDVSSLEYVVHAAAPCAPEIKRAMIDWWGPIIYEYYGSTEMSAVTLCSPEDALKYPGTVGRPISDATVRVYDDDGREVPAGTPGHIYGWMHSVTDFTYQGDPDKRRAIARDQLISVGDIGYFNEDGRLFLCDRANDMVISGGVNIYPAEIEAVLIQHEAVRDCAVFGIPDEEFGEVLIAVVEPAHGHTPTADALQAFARARLAGYKVPKHIEFRSDLPREDSGKLFKRKLREPYWQQTGRSI